MNQLPMASGYQDVIIRAAQDPNFDVDKLERLVVMQEARELRQGEHYFNEALAKAQREMSTISTNANNPQTRSRYATFARLDGEIRDIYTSHGFGIQFNTEPMGEPNMLRVVGNLSNGIVSRRFQIDMPIVTQGIKGADMMTRTHATMSAVSYGKRGLLVMMFNLAIGDDDDGNAAGRRAAPEPVRRRASEVVDPETGEITEVLEKPPHQTPALIEMGDQEEWQSWVPRFLRPLKTAETSDEVQQWLDLNTATLRRLADEKDATYAGLMQAITAYRKKLPQ